MIIMPPKAIRPYIKYSQIKSLHSKQFKKKSDTVLSLLRRQLENHTYTNGSTRSIVSKNSLSYTENTIITEYANNTGFALRGGGVFHDREKGGNERDEQ